MKIKWKIESMKWLFYVAANLLSFVCLRFCSFDYYHWKQFSQKKNPCHFGDVKRILYAMFRFDFGGSAVHESKKPKEKNQSGRKQQYPWHFLQFDDHEWNDILSDFHVPIITRNLSIEFSCHSNHTQKVNINSSIHLGNKRILRLESVSTWESRASYARLEHCSRHKCRLFGLMFASHSILSASIFIT